VAEWLRGLGHDAVHLSERGAERLLDCEIFAVAAKEQRVIVTCDLDFGEILAASGGKSVSAIVFRLSNPRADRVMVRLADVLGRSRLSLEQGAIILVEDARHRVRRLPIGG
jgi:predicted nuclease of predicted toxin-antitoxin system